MVGSYVGIITKRGLESLIPETEHALMFLMRRLARHGHEAFCYWVVMSEEDARRAALQIQSQHFFDALVTVNQSCVCIGSVAPGTTVDSAA